jgi:hypothetical protein
MIEKDVIEQLKENTRIEHQRALGIWDLPLGMLIFVFGLQALLHGGDIFGFLLIPAYLLFYDARKRYILPRLGIAEFDSKSKKQNMIFFIILSYLLVSLAAVTVLIDIKTGKGSHVNPGSMTYYMSLFCAAIVCAGGFLRRTIFYIYGSVAMIPLILGLNHPNQAFVFGMTVLIFIATSALLRLFVYDWTGLDKAQQKPGIVGHYLVGFIALGLMVKLFFAHNYPGETNTITAQIMSFSNFYAGIITSGLVFLVGYAYSIKSFYWYAPVILLFSIVYRLQIMTGFTSSACLCYLEYL